MEFAPLLWWGLMAAVLLLSVVSGGCGRSTPGRTGQGEGQSLGPAFPCPKPTRTPSLRVTAKRLDHDFAYLKAASADATYRGKWLVITGTLTRVPQKLATEQWEMLLRTDRGAAPLKLWFPRSCPSGLRARLGPRSRITATCRINNSIEIVDCSLH